MIDRTHDLPVTRQCQILSLARSSAYYRPQEASEADLALMRRIGELYLEHSFCGSRMLCDMLRRERHYIGFYNSRRPHRALDGITPDAFCFAHLHALELAA